MVEKKREHTMILRWKHFSTKTSSSSVNGICKAMSDGRKIARARTMRRMSFFSNLDKAGEHRDLDMSTQ